MSGVRGGLRGLLLICMMPTVAMAGYSGPGGPRLRYDAFPKIEPHPKTETPTQAPALPTGPRLKKADPRDQGAMRSKNAGKLPSNAGVGGSSTTQPIEPQIETRKPIGATGPDAQTQQPQQSAKAKPEKFNADKDAQRRQLLTRLYGLLSSAKDNTQAQRIAQSIEQIWLHSGSPTTDLLMKRTDRAIETGRWSVAETFIDAVVRLQPEFTEGWMRRALINYQRRQPTRALRDLRRVIALEPNHFVALDRIGAILESVGESKAALDAYRNLKRLHPKAPGLTERIEELTRKVDGEQI